MSKTKDHEGKSPSQLIDERISQLADGRGEMLSRQYARNSYITPR